MFLRQFTYILKSSENSTQKNKDRVLLLLCLSMTMLASAGCGPGWYWIKPVLQREMESINLDTYRFREDQGMQQPIAYAKAVTTAKDRNRLQTIIMEQSDAMCEEHKGEIVETASSSNLFLNIGTSALSGTAAVVKGALAKSALAAGAGFTSATAAEISDKVYQRLFVGTIVRAIDKSREEKAKLIGTDRAKAIEDYTVDDAIRDAQDYHQRCSFYQGIVLLNEAIERNQLSTDDLIKHAEVLRTQINETERLRAEAEKAKRDSDKNKYDAIKRGLVQQLEDTYRRIGAVRK